MKQKELDQKARDIYVKCITLMREEVKDIKFPSIVDKFLLYGHVINLLFATVYNVSIPELRPLNPLVDLVDEQKRKFDEKSK